MEPGDFVITPSWTFHHHSGETDRPMVWLDGLDIPLVALINSTFREDHPDDEAPVTRPAGDARPLWQRPAAGRLQKRLR